MTGSTRRTRWEGWQGVREGGEGGREGEREGRRLVKKEAESRPPFSHSVTWPQKESSISHSENHSSPPSLPPSLPPSPPPSPPLYHSQDALAGSSDVAQEALSNVRTVHAFAAVGVSCRKEGGRGGEEGGLKPLG